MILGYVDCHARGFDVLAANSCNPLGFPLMYSPLWLSLPVMPVTDAWRVGTGLANIGFFLFGMTLIPPPARRGWKMLVMLAAVVSGSVAFAVERSNIDITMFGLAAVSVRLLLASRRARAAGYAFALLAGMLKFYPFTLLILALSEPLLGLIAVSAAAAITLATFVAVYGRDIIRAIHGIPTGPFFAVDAFSGQDVAYGLASLSGWPVSVSRVIMASMTLCMIAYAVKLSGRAGLRDRVRQLPPAELAFLAAGSVMMITCFLTAQNVTYRCIHFLFVLPGLLALVEHPGSRRDRPLVLGLCGILSLMWSEVVRTAINQIAFAVGVDPTEIGKIYSWLWLARELTWWAVITMLATFLIAWLARSRALTDLRLRMFPSSH